MSDSTHRTPSDRPAQEEHKYTRAPTRLAADLLKEVNRKFVTGVTLVTAMDDGVPRGLAVNAFAINIASTSQMEVMGKLSSKSADKFAGVDWTPGVHGSPILAGSSAHMEVEIRERLQASTHTVFICRVVDAAVSDEVPVIYSAGRFFDPAELNPLT